MEYENNEFLFSLSKSSLGFKYHRIFIVDKRGGSNISFTGDQVDCLIDGLYHLTSRRSRAANACGHCHWLPENKGESCHVPGCRFYPPPA